MKDTGSLITEYGSLKNFPVSHPPSRGVKNNRVTPVEEDEGGEHVRGGPTERESSESGAGGRHRGRVEQRPN